MYPNTTHNGLSNIPHTPSNNVPISFDSNPYISATKTVQFKVTPSTPQKRRPTDENTPHTSYFRAQPWKKPKTRHAPSSRSANTSRSPLTTVQHANDTAPSVPLLPHTTPSFNFTPSTPTPLSRAQVPTSLDHAAFTLADRAYRNVVPVTPTTNPKQLTIPEKRMKMYRSMQECDWTFGDFLWHMSYHEGLSDRSGHEHWHAQVMSKFLQGKTMHKPIEIINLWFTSHYGALPRGTDGFDFDTPYLEIPHIRLSVMAMAAQLVEKKVKLEAKKAVKPEAGLHATLRKKGSHKMEWKDIGATTVWEVGQLLKTLQPTTWRLLEGVVGAKSGRTRRRLM